MTFSSGVGVDRSAALYCNNAYCGSVPAGGGRGGLPDGHPSQGRHHPHSPGRPQLCLGQLHQLLPSAIGQLQHHPAAQRRLDCPRDPARTSPPTQCSLTLTHPQARDKKILGIALVSVPKDSSSIESTYKMSQSEDRTAEVSLKMRIIPIEGSSSVVRNRADLSVESTPVSRMQQHSSQNIKVQSKMSGASSAGSEGRRLFKVVEEDKMI